MTPSVRRVTLPLLALVVLASCGGTKAVTPAPCPTGASWYGSQCLAAATPPPTLTAIPTAPPIPIVAAPPPVPPPAPPGPSCPAGMASLPGGSFTMGDRKDDVTVQPFCLDLTEVTADAFAACVRAGACNADLPGAQKVSDCGKGGNNNALVRGRGAHPMNCVDAGQSSTYCASQGKRLPTEEEWEWAAHGASEGRVYPWGNAQPDSQLCWSGKWCKEGVPTGDPHTQCNWTELLARDSTCPVGSFAAGDAPGGIHDLAGNVSEWTSSNFDASGTKRVTRGGGWSAAIASAMRAADRYPIAPTTRGMWLGFRCAR